MSWQERSTGLPTVPRHLAVDPNDTAIVYASFGEEGTLYKTTDAGQLWTQLPYSIPRADGEGVIWAMAAAPYRDNTLWLGTWARGLHRSIDGGRTFRTRVFYSDNASASWTMISSPPAAAAEPIQRILLPTLPPASVLNLTGTVMGGSIILSWTLPSDTKFQGVHIRGDAAGPPRTSVEGTVHVTLAASWITYTAALPAIPTTLSSSRTTVRAATASGPG